MSEFVHTVTNLDAENEYPKLVRDNIPEIIYQHDGIQVPTRVLDDREYEWHLRKKVVEEATELREATSDEHLLEEIVDVQELIDTLKRLKGISDQQVTDVMDQKRAVGGGFSKRILMLGNVEEK